MEWNSVESSMIRSIAYDDKDKQLGIEFQSGAVYAYSGVPDNVYQELMIAPSKGQCFLTTIRDQYSFKRIR